MPLTIRFGDTYIVDVNDNNLYDPKIDRVGATGKKKLSVAEIDSRLKSILDQLHTPQWKGILLTRAAAYLRYFSEARSMAEKGAVEECAQILEKAIIPLRTIPVPYDQNKAVEIHQLALLRGVEVSFQRAERFARKEIHLLSALMEIQGARRYTERYEAYGKLLAFDKARADSIVVDALKNGIPPLYIEADTLADKGELDEVRRVIQSIDNFIEEANTEYALGLRFDLARADQILLKAFQNAVPKYYKDAESAANYGDIDKARDLIQKIDQTIKEANAEFQLGWVPDQARLDRILEIALFRGVEAFFQMGLNTARQKDLLATLRMTTRAEDCALEYNQKFAILPGRKAIKFDIFRANGIVACALRSGPCW
jgi:hypothetical protein